MLGFEYGYSLAYPNALVIWEAQFGDFVNGAQIIIDQYIASSAQKWRRYSGIVLLLPHGFEGQGPEHSSARLERFLQLAAELNMQVAYPTTPAQYFHLLVRQVKRKIRIPLIVMTPKGLLRLPECVSSLNDFEKGSFQEIIADEKGIGKVDRILMCSGRIYYDLLKKKRDNVLIIRIEQLYPFHMERARELLENYKAVKDVLWVQEEPKNMGAWSYISPILQEIVGSKLRYVGREASASPATGSHSLHEKQQNQIIESAYES